MTETLPLELHSFVSSLLKELRPTRKAEKRSQDPECTCRRHWCQACRAGMGTGVFMGAAEGHNLTGGVLLMLTQVSETLKSWARTTSNQGTAWSSCKKSGWCWKATYRPWRQCTPGF